MEVGSLSNHVNSCVFCVCLLFNFSLFTVVDLSSGVLSAQQLGGIFGQERKADNSEDGWELVKLV